MACLVERRNGNPVRVRLEDGRESQMFNQLLTSPLINSANTALSLYEENLVKLPQDITTNYPDIMLTSTGEPVLLYKVGDYYTSSLRKALQREGDVIEMGYLYPRQNTPVEVQNAKNIDFPSNQIVYRNTNLGVEGSVISPNNFYTMASMARESSNSVNGIMLEAIQYSVLNENLGIKDGRRVFYGTGTNSMQIQANSMASMLSAQTNPQLTNLQATDGLYTFNYEVFDMNSFIVGNETLTMEEFEERMKQGDVSLKDDPNFISNLYKNAMNRGFRFRPISASTKSLLKTKTLQEVESDATSILEEAGVTDTAFEDFQSRFRLLNGRDINLAETQLLLNDLMYFYLGESITQESLSDLIVDMNQGTEVMETLLLDIVQTNEYSQASIQYSDILNQAYTKFESETEVRKKAISKALINRSNTQVPVESTVTEQLDSLINSTRNTLSSNITPETLNKVSDFNNDVVTQEYSNNVGDTSILPGKETVIFYSPASFSADYQGMVNTVIATKERLVRIAPKAPTLGQLSNETIEANLWESMVKVVATLEQELGHLSRELEGSVSKGEPISMEAHRAYVNIKRGIAPLINDLRLMVQEHRNSSPLSKSEVRRLIESLDKNVTNFSTLEGYYNRHHSRDAFRTTVLDDMYKTLNWDAETINRFEELTYGEQRDVNVIMASIGSLANRGNPILSVMNYLAGSVSAKTVQDYNTKALPLFDEFLERGYNEHLDGLINRDSSGNRTEWLISPLKFEEGLRDRENSLKQIRYELVRLNSQQISQIDTRDEADLLARNVLAEIIGNSSLSNRFTQNNTGDFVVRLTEQDYQNSLASISESIAQINKIYGTNIVANELLIPASSFTTDLYRIGNITDATVRQLIQGQLPGNPLELNKNQRAQYQVRMSEYDAQNREQMFTDDYYKAELDILNDPKNKGIELGVMTLKSINRDIGAILSKYRSNGRVDFSQIRLDPVDGPRLAQLEKLRAYRSNPYMENPIDGEDLFKPNIYSEIIDGRKVYRARDLSDDDIAAMSEDDLITWGIIRLNESRTYSRGEISQEFIDQVLDLEAISPQDAYDFLRYNSAIGLTDDFFSDVEDHQSYLDRVTREVRNIQEPDLQERAFEILDEYKRQFGRLKYYSRINRSVTNIGEVDFTGNEADMAAVREIDETLQVLRQSLPSAPSEGAVRFERGVTESYINELNNRGIEEYSEDEYEFLLGHVTNRSDFEKFNLALKGLQRHGIPLNERNARYYIAAQQRVGGDPDADVYMQARIEYLRGNVPSYFSRYSPLGFNDLMTALREGVVRPSMLINKDTAPAEFQNVIQYIQLNPRYDWATNIFNERNLNPRYRQDGLGVQLNKEKWINPEFFNRFGIDPAEYLDNNKDVLSDDPALQLQPTKDIEGFETLQRWLRIRQMNVDAKGMHREVSPYRVPRISRTQLEKVKALVDSPISAIKETIKDFTSYRVDETDAPRDVTGKNIITLGEVRTLPRYYETELEDPTNQTQDYLGALAKDTQQAFLYKNRKEVETKVLATLQQMEMQQFEEGKQGSESNAYSKLKEYTDAMFYDRAWNNEVKFRAFNKTIYLSKLFGSFNRLFSNTNLAYNIFVDITGMTTSALTRFTIGNSNEYFRKSSLNFANTEVTSMNAELLAEAGNLRKTSRMIRILETIGIKNPTDRIENTRFSRGVRLLGKSPYAGADISNLTNTSRVVVAMLKDHRLVTLENGENRFLNFNEYERLLRSQDSTKNMTIPEIEESFDALADKSLYDLATFEYGIHISDTANVPQDEADRLQNTLYQKVGNVVEIADTVIGRENRTWMQRNPLLKLMTTHKGWLAIGLDRAFKSPQFNLRANTYEAGRYNAISRLLQEAYQNVGSLNPMKIAMECRRLANEPGELNYNTYLTYAKLEAALLTVMTALGVGVLAATEDDDAEDLWALQFAGFMYIRTLSELNSISGFGLGGAVKDTFEQPFVSATYITRLLDLSNYSTEEVRSGKYAGLPKWWAQLMRLSIGKRFYDIYNIRDTYSSYRHWNSDTLPFLHEGGSVDKVLLPWLRDED